MPVFIREAYEIPPPSKMDGVFEDSDYVMNPDMVRDFLPQPYRLVDKVVKIVFDDAWDIITRREDERIAEKNRYKPPKCESTGELPEFKKTCCLADSTDGKYIFLGLSNGLAAIDCESQATIATLADDNMNIVQMSVVLLGVQTYILVTIDDFGVARLFGFTGSDCFYLLKTFNDRETSSKSISSKCQCSNDAENCGVVLEDTNTTDKWLEVYKLPKDAWIKELDNLKAQANKPETTTPAELNEASATEPPSTADTAKTEDAEESKPRSSSPTTGLAGQNVKFAATTLVLKVKAPGQVNTCNTASLANVMKSLDTGDVVGTGNNNFVSAQHLQMRNSVFETLHRDQLSYLPEEDSKPFVQPSFHFFTSGRLLPYGLEQASYLGRTVAVGVWWTDSNQMMFYNLLKQGKAHESKSRAAAAVSDVEHKPDIVWPFASSLTASATTKCTTLLAIGLENGNVIIWDKNLGMPLNILSVSDKSSITNLTFLNPSIFNQDKEPYPPYPTPNISNVLATTKTGLVEMIPVRRMQRNIPTEVIGLPNHDNDFPTLVKIIDALPELALVVTKNGSVFIYDILRRKQLCQISLPERYCLMSPWEPVITIDGSGNILVAKGQKIEPDEEEDDSSMYFYTLKNLPALENYWKNVREEIPYLVHTNVTDRVDAFVKQRQSTMADRQKRLQARWSTMKEQMKIIQEARESIINKKMAAHIVSL